jgi:hypothetical protein
VLWNLLHDWYIWGGPCYGAGGRPSIAEMDRQVRDARAKPLRGWEWLAQLPAQASQQVLKDSCGLGTGSIRPDYRRSVD